MLAAPAVGLGWLLRPKWRPGLAERLGRIPSEAGAAAPIWIHAASVGEAAAALRLVDALAERGHTPRVSTTTITGQAFLASARPKLTAHLAPLDHPWAVAAAFERARPKLLTLVETELWPSLVAGAAARGIPVVMVSARLSDRAFPRYQRLARWFAPTLARLSAVAARSDVDAERFAALGVPEARISVTGDLKLEPMAPPPLAEALRARLGGEALLVAGSVHPGEVPPVLEAFRRVQDAVPGSALVLAPRHPERFDEAARSIAEAGFPLERRSEHGPPLGPGGVLLLDSVGELGAVYAAARSAFVGGSLLPGVGGHNVLEPVFAERPVCFGPHTENAREPVRIVLESGAGTKVDDAASLASAFVRDLADPAAAHRRGSEGRAALAPHEGAARRAAACIEAVLEAAS